MKCPGCGDVVTRREGESFEEFRERWEAATCDPECEVAAR